MKPSRNTIKEVGVVSYHGDLFDVSFVGMKLKIAVIDLVSGEVGPAEPMRAEQGWTVGELKQYIGEVREEKKILIFMNSLPPSLFLPSSSPLLPLFFPSSSPLAPLLLPSLFLVIQS